MSTEELDVTAQAARVEASKAADADPLDSEEVQKAAGYYSQLCKSVRGYSSVMNGKGLARVLVALAEFPYGETYPKFKKGSHEQQLFTFMLTIQSAKSVIAKALEPQLQQLSDQAVDGIVKEVQEQTKGEDTNGNKVD